MANLYTHEISQKGPDLTRYGSLFSLLTSESEFMIDGVRILRKGSTEWNAYLADFRSNVEKTGRSPIEIEEIMRGRASDKYIVVTDTPFSAMHYRGKRLIYDHDGGVIGEIAVVRKQIDFFHLVARPVDRAKKAGMGRSFCYDGSLYDALEEFGHEGFTFNLLGTTWYPDYIVNEERTKKIRVTPTERVSINEVIDWRSQQ